MSTGWHIPTINSNYLFWPRILWDEIYWACEERYRFFRKDPARIIANWPLPVYYFDENTSKAWGADYPSGNPGDPDDKMRLPHLYNMRILFGTGGITGIQDYHSEKVETNGFENANFINQFVYDLTESGWSDRFYDYSQLKDDIGINSYSERFTDPFPNSIDVDPFWVKKIHFTQPRACVELLQEIFMNPTSVQYRERTGTDNSITSMDDVEDELYTAWAAASWGSWQNGTVFSPWEFHRFHLEYDQDSEEPYDITNIEGYVKTREFKVTFDLSDLEIVGDSGWPPSYHPYDSWPNIMPPTSAKIYITGGADYGDLWYASSQSFSGLYIKNKSDSVQTEIELDVYANSDPWQLHIADAISKFSSSITLEFSSYNEWSEADVKQACSDLGSTEHSGDHYYCKRSLALHDTVSYSSPAGGEIAPIALIVKPNWKYGAP